jgi:hypothetical protein
MAPCLIDADCAQGTYCRTDLTCIPCAGPVGSGLMQTCAVYVARFVCLSVCLPRQSLPPPPVPFRRPWQPTALAGLAPIHELCTHPPPADHLLSGTPRLQARGPQPRTHSLH